jgi:hypothetical protein
VAQGESQVTILNNTHGLNRLKLVVNGHMFKLANLADGERRQLDVSAAMRKGNNTLTIAAQGGGHGTASILVADNQRGKFCLPPADSPEASRGGLTFVLKRLDGPQLRDGAIYRELLPEMGHTLRRRRSDWTRTGTT